MGKDTKISWCDHSWGPWRGCHKVSAECKNCYMFRDQKRYGRDPNTVIRAAKATFNAPLKWPTGKVFVCSWSDFWIEEADAWRADALDVMAKRPDHTYIIPTKRPELALKRIREIEDQQYNRWDHLFPNVWGLVSAGTQKSANKFIPKLLETPFAIRGVSVEPMLEHVILPRGIDWIIIGCESDSGGRVGRLGSFENETDWIIGAQRLVEQAKSFGVSIYIKQIPIGGRVNHNPDEWPMDLRVREYPNVATI